MTTGERTQSLPDMRAMLTAADQVIDMWFDLCARIVESQRQATRTALGALTPSWSPAQEAERVTRDASGNARQGPAQRSDGDRSPQRV